MTDSDPSQQLLDYTRRSRFGKYRGLVKDNADPTQRGRLKVQVKDVLGDLEVWAMPCVPYAGAGMGFYARPEPDTGAWVEFEGGDTSYPIVTGFFWADDQLPKDEGGNVASPALKIMRTKEGLILDFDDQDQEIREQNKRILWLQKATSEYAQRVTHLMRGIVILLKQLSDEGSEPCWQPNEWDPPQEESKEGTE